MALENLEITFVLNINVLFANCFSNGFFKLLYTYSLNVLTLSNYLHPRVGLIYLYHFS
jgi:hypothetical protein